MVNKKIVVGVLIVFAILAVVVVASTKNPTTAPEITIQNAKVLPVEQPVSDQTIDPEPALSDDTNSVTCQQPPVGNQYGGIGGVENNPPKDTVISKELTIQYGRPTATGICGTYWYIAGWWFNASEMARLPSETILYGMSPYAITEGTDGGTNGDNEDGGPIVPVPEVATILLVIFGIFMFIVLKKVRK